MSKSRKSPNAKGTEEVMSYAYTVPPRRRHRDMIEDPVMINPANALLALLHMFQEKFRYKDVFSIIIQIRTQIS